MKTHKERHIYPIFNEILGRNEKEAFLNQKAVVIWMTGLSGSGKSTVAKHLERLLFSKGFFTQVIDGDNVRTGINNNLGFSKEDRNENIRRVAEVSKLFLNCGIITINCFVSPTVAYRQMAKEIIGDEDFLEVYINAPVEVCEQRDVKGLYKKARAGEIKDFTGISAPFEAPEHPDHEIRTDQTTVEEAVQALFEYLEPHISFQGKPGPDQD
ncbi:MAG: adenylyl-sulfate kinase [Flavobacteriales bacterium]|nr:adenylyl-sulfate kinase [Flavobacteriales bacterium]MCB9449238.1 adenylyl-sulfate kinase [Flavobacteriales bacterium]